jgi:hypothetical protein
LPKDLIDMSWIIGSDHLNNKSMAFFESGKRG